MKLDIRRLERNQEGKFDYQLSEQEQSFSYKGELIRFEGPVEVKGVVKKIDDSYLVSGEVKTVIILKCSRCLKDFPYAIRTLFLQGYEKSPQKEDVLSLRGDVIDLEHIVLESIILELPIKALCSENCKGLCPVCGIDRNIEKCCCRQEEIDPRLASLKKFFEE